MNLSSLNFFSMILVQLLAQLSFELSEAHDLQKNTDVSITKALLDCKSWQVVPLAEKHFTKAYDGFGQIHFNQGLTLQPRSVASESPKNTHAALALLNDGKLRKNFAIRLRYKNEKAFRKPAANSWEVFWLFFNYRNPSDRAKQTNYFIFKPNGVELGKAWGELDQEFLKTAAEPKANIGQNYDLVLIKKDKQVLAYIDDQLVLNFNSQPNKKLFESPGQIGLYSEDAQVRIDRLEICDLPN